MVKKGEVQVERSSAVHAPTVDWWKMLADPDFLANLYADLKRIRELAPVHHEAVYDVYFVLGHREFRRMATAPEMGRDTRLWTNGWNSEENKQRDPLSYELFSDFQPQMTNVDKLEHRRMRDVYEKAFRQNDLKVYVPMIEEACRDLLPGGSFIVRVANQDYQCGDVRIPAGALAIGLVAAISRDPEPFVDPDAFDIARQPNPHLVFGGGPHICLGKALVRMTAEVAFAALLDRFELAGEPVWWTHCSDQHGLHSLPLQLGNA